MLVGLLWNSIELTRDTWFRTDILDDMAVESGFSVKNMLQNETRSSSYDSVLDRHREGKATRVPGHVIGGMFTVLRRCGS